MARIAGIGGVFFKSRNDSTALVAWYQKHLGMSLESFGGAVLRWPDDKAEDKGLTVWHIAEKESQWFSPSDSPFMINYRVFMPTNLAHVRLILTCCTNRFSQSWKKTEHVCLINNRFLRRKIVSSNFKRKFKFGVPSIPSWNRIMRWLKEMETLRPNA